MIRKAVFAMAALALLLSPARAETPTAQAGRATPDTLIGGKAVLSGDTKPTGQIKSLDLSALDTTVDPCEDFYEYACGNWRKNNPVPSDQPLWGRFNELVERNRAILHGILQDAAKAPARAPAQQKIGDYFASCMDEAAINSKGISVLKPELDRITALNNKEAVPALLAHLHGEGISVLFNFSSGADFKNAKEIIGQADEPSFSLPDRDYYLKNDDKSADLRKAFVQHVTKMFQLLGDAPEKAAAEADVLMRLETALARGAVDPVERRNPENVYHKFSLAEWQALTPSLSWSKYLAGIGTPAISSLNVAAPGFFKVLDAEFKAMSLEDLKTYLRWHLVRSVAAVLPTPFVEENFDFYGKTLTGAGQLEPRWHRCVDAVDGDLGEALGQVYVEKYFPPQAKEQTLKMVHQLETALRQDIGGLPWMTETTKKQALTKLEAIQNKIGYPDHWLDYSGLKIVRGDAFGNSLRSNAFAVQRQLGKIGKASDKGEWLMTPPTVDAYYNPVQNNINFPAGALQPPFYDFKADDALNLGAMGSVIGHELTHGFDDQGRRFDGEGNLHDWWTAEDSKAFEERAKCLVDEYDGFVVTDGVHLRGKLTLNENTADNGGVRIAFLALMATLAANQPGKIDGFTPEQRFFLGWGQVWCQNQTDEFARLWAQTNGHSSGRYRVNGVLQNMPEFQKAFSCKASQKMVSPKACRVW